MPRDYNFKFEQIKKIVLFIWSYRCYVCKQQSPNNHIHHINKNPFDNGSHNLIPLCKQCHKAVHKYLNLDNVVFPDDVAEQLWKLDEIWKKFGN